MSPIYSHCTRIKKFLVGKSAIISGNPRNIYIYITKKTLSNSVGSTNLSLKYQRSTLLGCTDIGIRKLDFVAKTQFLSRNPRNI